MMRLPGLLKIINRKLLEREAEIVGMKVEGGISEGLKSKLGKGVLIISHIEGEIVIIHLLAGKED